MYLRIGYDILYTVLFVTDDHLIEDGASYMLRKVKYEKVRRKISANARRKAYVDIKAARRAIW